MSEVKMVEVIIDPCFDSYDLDGPIVDAIKKLQQIIVDAKNAGLNSIKLIDDTGQDEPTHWKIVGYRPENVDEKKKRLIKAQKECQRVQAIRSTKEQKEKELLKKLARKYGCVDIINK